MFDGEAVVLTNLSTAGAAEAIAAAFAERKRSEVVGEQTFGAGTQQELFQLQQRCRLPVDRRQMGFGIRQAILGRGQSFDGRKANGRS